MDALRKVIWAEGMFLGQQHFQLWDRYYETYQSLQVRSLSPMGWGVISLDIDEEALENSRFRIRRCQVIFPDGRLVSYDAADGPPLAMELEGGISRNVEIHLCLPANRSASGINGYQDHGQLCSWAVDYQRVPDENDPSREREVMLGRPNLMLLSGEESRENFTWLKLAEVRSEGDGVYTVVPDYIPPIARIGASPRLRDYLQRMIELFSAKVRTLNDRRRQQSATTAGFGHSDLSNFLILQTLSGGLPLLQHFQENDDLHPERLYTLLARVVGALTPFSFEIDVHRIPRYRHHDLAGVFGELETLVRGLVDVAMPTNLDVLQLQRESDTLLSVDNIDSQLLAGSSFYLAVLSDSDDPMWVTHFERMVKAASRADIEMVVASALPGLRIAHTQRPPSNLPIKSGYEYFHIEPRGEFWDRVLEERTLALFLSRDFTSVKLELLTVQD